MTTSSIQLARRLLDSRLLTPAEVAEAQASAEDLREWLGRQALLPDLLARQAEAGEPLRLGRYRVVGRLGRGGMGVVLRGIDERMGREVAIKVLSAKAKERHAERFRREAVALARLDHPHVVRVYDCDDFEGVLFLVMELVPGRSLGVRLRRDGPLDEEHAWELLRQTADALAYAEEQGILHRDVKPDNILWDEQDSRYVLCDLGLARFSEGEDGSLTLPGTTLGTPDFMSPEQAKGEEVDARSDMYSLGLCLFEALTGGLPFPDGVKGLAHRLREDVPNVRTIQRAISSDLAGLVARLCAREPEDRWPSWEGVLDSLDALEAPPEEAVPVLPQVPAAALSSSARRRALRPGRGSDRALRVGRASERVRARRRSGSFLNVLVFLGFVVAALAVMVAAAAVIAELD